MPPRRSCGRRWPGSTRVSQTERMAFPSWVEQGLLPQVLRVHDAVYQKTNGWIGHRALWIPSLLLHTVGAKTGKARTASLIYAATAMTTWSLLPSRATRTHPAGTTTCANARSAKSTSAPSDSRSPRAASLRRTPEYARLWEIVNKNNANRYDGYQTRTSRPIPIVALTPA